MNAKQAAEILKSYGREGDTELVHMTKGEVAGLQQLAQAAGGSLTINPVTGQPEAFFLAALLPTIIGGVGSAMGMGALGTAALGAGVGALTNKNDPLMGALTGAMGGYGGGQLASGLTGLGSGAASANAQAIANPALAGQALGTGAGSQSAMLAAQNAGFGAEGLGQLAQAAGAQAPSGASVMGAGLQSAVSNPMSYMSQLGGPMKALQAGSMAAAPAMYGSMFPGQKPVEEGVKLSIPGYEYDPGQTGDYYGTGGNFSTSERQFFNPTYTRTFAEGGTTDPAMNYLMGQSNQSPLAAQAQQMMSRPTPPVQPMIDRSAMPQGRGFTERLVSDGYHFNPETQQFIPKQRAVYDRVRTPSSEGETMFPNMRRGFLQMATMAKMMQDRNKPASERGNYDLSVFRQKRQYADGGIASLAQGGSVNMQSGDFVIPADVVAYAGGGSTEAGMAALSKKLGAVPIKGAGNGLSDDIPATIDGKQPARVANGEMLVKQPGKKGSQKLYGMMKNIRKQATGTTKQVRPVNLDKALA